MLSLADRWIVEFDRALRTLSGVAHPSRPSPAASEDLAELLPEERSKSGALMRVDHSGEVCAQALYSGQALTARDPARREALLQAAREEGDHLAWTRDRLRERHGIPWLVELTATIGHYGMVTAQINAFELAPRADAELLPL